ncbi:hypothetical protein RBU49_16610 [Clostridium sp. MB40-C1]|uniref:hypothetical protein n=1 Tax=Clostridium sp. MB40-C1 TaxID=3070996 RepID=UPI0027DF2B51|nr:hypothetical protein [Clostridium sp. MB40-C1]WMJ80404.1 hypothetical protein RBU49_16610 [Clostridium sp. MB40-C1]
MTILSVFDIIKWMLLYIFKLNPTWVYEQDKLIGRDRCWINVKLSNGETGWVSKRALDMTNR